MRYPILATSALLLFATEIPAMANSTRIAETGAYLLGNAHRCGVPTDRVEQAGKVIHDLIVAASDDSTEETIAEGRFAQMFMASAFPDQDGDALIPPCKVVIAQFDRLERHHQQAGMN